MKFYKLNFFTNAIRYFNRYFKRETLAWMRVAIYYAVFTPFLIAGIVGLVMYVKPVGPKTASLAIGQAGSSYGLLAEQYQSIFTSYGLKLDLINTEGLSDGVKALDDPKSVVNASFVTAGFATGKQYPNLVSLGSVQYAPIWLFYKGEKITVDDPFEYFSSKKIGIGLPNTNANKIFRQLLEANQKNALASKSLYELPHVEAAQQLQLGKLDAVFIVDSFNAPVVQSLLKDSDVKIMSFNLADAYVKKFKFLQKLIVPKGSYDLENIKPNEDIVLLSSTTNLLIEKDTHPALQWAFMMAANETGKYTEDFFSQAGAFPKYIDLSFPLSPIAKRFYSQGTPVFFDYLPLWLGSLLDNIWVLILAFVALIYPMFKWLMGVRYYPSKKYLYRNFIALRDLDEDISKVSNKEEAQALLSRLNSLNMVNNAQWLGEAEARFYFTQKGIIQPMQKRLIEKIAEYEIQIQSEGSHKSGTVKVL